MPAPYPSLSNADKGVGLHYKPFSVATIANPLKSEASSLEKMRITIESAKSG